ncbi:hypothetical protein [Caulobacter endophyticus]|nr:hypothetical protein [Caulobacter endophyticus]MDG2531024.1 hypothetical protein [Caulobacter endophyticus]
MSCFRGPIDWVLAAWFFGWPIIALIRFEIRMRQGRYDSEKQDGPS